MKKYLHGIAILFFMFLSINCAYANQVSKKEQKKVMISQVIDHPALNATVDGIIEGLAEAGYKRGVNLDLRVESAQASVATAAQIANKFVAQKPDVVVGVGTISAQSFTKYAALNRVKLIFSSVTDPIAANLAVSEENAISNISGVSNFTNLEPQLQLFKDLQPNIKRLGIIYNPGEINSISMVRKLEKICAKYNLILIKQTITKTADAGQAVAKLASTVDAIFVTNDNTALSSIQSIIQTAQKHNKPVYVSDTDVVENGAIAALGPNQFEIGRQTGRMIAKVLEGTEVNTIPIEFPEKNDLIINLDAASKVNLTIPRAKLTQAANIIKQSKS